MTVTIVVLAALAQVGLGFGVWQFAKRLEVPMTDEEQATVRAIAGGVGERKAAR